MTFPMLPPEINSALMFSGAGSGPMLEAAAAWDGLAAELSSAADSFSSVTSGLAGQAWQGPASQAMMAAAVPYSGWLSTASAQAWGAAAQAKAVASAFESAVVATVHPVLVEANRSDFVSLVMSNLFGQNAPAIAAAESQYEQMWAQDVAAMVGYHGGASAAAAQLTSQAFQAIPSGPNYGYGNVGSLNFGFFNNGFSNLGIANQGSYNLGIGNISPLTTDPLTAYNVGGVGLFNNGNLNLGGWNTGFDNAGFGNVGTNNNGLPIPFASLIGLGNNGISNHGYFNFGTNNWGIGNTGNNNIGIGLTGNNQIGIGPLAFAV